jgi:hypothetical protein
MCVDLYAFQIKYYVFHEYYQRSKFSADSSQAFPRLLHLFQQSNLSSIWHENCTVIGMDIIPMSAKDTKSGKEECKRFISP